MEGEEGSSSMSFSAGMFFSRRRPTRHRTAAPTDFTEEGGDSASDVSLGDDTDGDEDFLTSLSAVSVSSETDESSSSDDDAEVRPPPSADSTPSPTPSPTPARDPRTAWLHAPGPRKRPRYQRGISSTPSPSFLSEEEGVDDPLALGHVQGSFLNNLT